MNSYPPEIEWHYVYNGSGEESHPHYVIETSDRGFLMIGETGFIYGIIPQKFMLLRLIHPEDLFGKRNLGMKDII